MILKTTARQPNTSVAAYRPPVADQWGQWSGHKHYSLEIVQHPLRARMCGFGDKDRRPLAPAAVAKMIVRRDDSSLVDVDDIDCSFFLVTADLWSADGTEEMNLVLHPSSADRYMPANNAKAKARQGSGSNQRSAQASPVLAHAAPTSTPQSMRATGDTPAGGMASISNSTSYAGQGYYPASTGDSLSLQPAPSYNTSPVEQHPTWGYGASTAAEPRPNYPTTVLPSIHSFNRNPSSSSLASGVGLGISTGDQWQADADTDSSGYRSWQQDQSYSSMNNPPPPLYSSSNQPQQAQLSGRPQQPWSTPSIAPPPPAPQPDPATQPRYGADAYPPSAQYEGSTYASASYAQQQSHASYYPSSYQDMSTGSGSLPPLPRHSYTRTLVGPLCANACRLLDEHRKPGVFFLFQDLSVRTEGAFRLRLRLMNVGAPPAPEAGSLRVHTDVSPVLAQVFTEPFVVFSAKRFPGVPDTTALSIAFGNQGQKLPLRNRHGTSKQGRRRHRGGSDGSDDDGSDGA